MSDHDRRTAIKRPTRNAYSALADGTFPPDISEKSAHFDLVSLRSQAHFALWQRRGNLENLDAAVRDSSDALEMASEEMHDSNVVAALLQTRGACLLDRCELFDTSADCERALTDLKRAVQVWAGRSDCKQLGRRDVVGVAPRSGGGSGSHTHNTNGRFNPERAARQPGREMAALDAGCPVLGGAQEYGRDTFTERSCRPDWRGNA